MKRPRILLYDIETRPNLGYVWGKWEQNVIAYKEEWDILCVAYKWLGESKVHSVTRDAAGTDRGIALKMKELFNEADIIIAHNGDSFDQKKVKARMVFHKLSPPKRVPSIDTRKIAKNQFAFNGNGLDELGQHLGLGRKVKHPGFEMWLGCMRGDLSSWRQMVKYNKNDVILLEKVYKRFLPWIQNHPNLSKLINPSLKRGCPNCGSNFTAKRGIRANHRGLQQQMTCTDCKTWFLLPYRKV